MITKLELQKLGFVHRQENHYSTHIGGPWYLHCIYGETYCSLQYGEKDMYKGDNVSIWATFDDLEKLRQLIELLKG